MTATRSSKSIITIPDSEVTDCSKWGPIDNGEDSSGEEQNDNKSETQPESIDIKIPTQEEEKVKDS